MNETVLEFQGYSDDTFGEHALTGQDYDNCGSGEPIRYRVSGGGFVVDVVGQYSPGDSACWLIGVEPVDEDCSPMGRWQFEYVGADRSYSPALRITIPVKGVKVICVTELEKGD